MTMKKKKLPIGIENFEELQKELNFKYVRVYIHAIRLIFVPLI